MIDHISLGVGDLKRARGLYTAALAPLEITPIYEFDDATGYGRDGNPFFWISRSDNVKPEQGLHIALAADSHEAVRAFHAAALAAGATGIPCVPREECGVPSPDAGVAHTQHRGRVVRHRIVATTQGRLHHADSG